MANEGYIKVYRKMLEWAHFKDSRTAHLWVYLLLKAQYKAGKGTLKANYKTIEYETGLNRNQIRNALRKLRKSGELTIMRTGNEMLITVNQFEHYQAGKDSKPKEKQTYVETEAQRRAHYQ